MEWVGGIVTIAFFAVLALYRKGVSQRNNLQNFIILILLNEEIWKVQRKGMLDVVEAVTAKNAMELGAKVKRQTASRSEAPRRP